MKKNEGLKIPLVNSESYATVDREDADFILRRKWYLVQLDDGAHVATLFKVKGGGGVAMLMEDLVIAMDKSRKRDGRDSVAIPVIQFDDDEPVATLSRGSEGGELYMCLDDLAEAIGA